MILGRKVPQGGFASVVNGLAESLALATIYTSSIKQEKPRENLKRQIGLVYNLLNEHLGYAGVTDNTSGDLNVSLLNTGLEFNRLSQLLKATEDVTITDQIDELSALAYGNPTEILRTLPDERGFVDLFPLDIVQEGLTALESDHITSHRFYQANYDVLKN